MVFNLGQYANTASVTRDSMNQAKVKLQKTVSKNVMGILLFLTVLKILNMVDCNLITSFGTDINNELNLSDFQFGLLTGLIFVVLYSIAGLFMGALADCVHRSRLIAAALIFGVF
jgi:uncharacterized protein Smg (DUF494 family)